METQASQAAPTAFGHGEEGWRAALCSHNDERHVCVCTAAFILVVTQSKLERYEWLTWLRKYTIVSVTVENDFCENSFCFTTTNLKESPSHQNSIRYYLAIANRYWIIGLSFSVSVLMADNNCMPLSELICVTDKWLWQFAWLSVMHL